MRCFAITATPVLTFPINAGKETIQIKRAKHGFKETGEISNFLCNTRCIVLWIEPSCRWAFGEHSKVHFATAVDTG